MTVVGHGTAVPASSCISAEHTVPEAATLEGVLDLTHVNGRGPRRLRYCTRCAVITEMGGMFTPERALLATGPLEQLRGPEWAQIARIQAPWTVAFLTDYATALAERRDPVTSIAQMAAALGWEPCAHPDSWADEDSRMRDADEVRTAWARSVLGA